MEATFNKYGVAFLQILAGNLSLASPKRYIDEDGLLFFLAVFDGIDSVHGTGIAGNRQRTQLVNELLA